MAEICQICGQPKELCVCTEISKESQKIKIRTVERRFKKIVTIITGFNKDVNINSIGKTLKKKLACGGTVKNGVIELQGNHKEEAKKLLVKEGFKEGLIETWTK